MRFGFDLRPFLKQETGVGVYYRNLLFELAAVDRENEYVLFSASWKDRFPAAKIPPFERRRFRDVKLPVRLVDLLWSRWEWPRLEAFFDGPLDLTHSPTPLLLPTRGKTIVTVYDLFFLDFPDRADRQARTHFARRIASALERADGIVTISRYTRDELLSRFDVPEAKVRAIPLGIDPDFGLPLPVQYLEALGRKHGLPAEFLLFVGAFEPRKNLPALVEAFGRVRARRPGCVLVLAGRSGADLPRIRAAIAASRLEEAVWILGYLPDRELRGLYQTASGFVYPSVCEGFGLPLLEAMASGCPVAASTAAAIPEVAGGAALLFPPDEVEAMAAALLRLIEDDGLRRTLADRGRDRVRAFGWAEMARSTLDFYRDVLKT
ncbi:MAG: glycosyltransferase family 4 protein [Candidatus Aminicenantes bacterium]|nr:glycosyltransferase family 4 protein [Candidatus Aminicenantes bacterium]